MLPFSILRSIWKYILFAIVILIVRSPILMFIVGFGGGVATYHFYPKETEAKVETVINQVEDILGEKAEVISKCISGEGIDCLPASGSNDPKGLKRWMIPEDSHGT